VKMMAHIGLQRIPGAAGERFATLAQHGSLRVEVYAPQGVDLQQPHSQDELYVVHAGSAELWTGDALTGEKRQFCQVGDALFVPAGAPHRFENFSDNFVTWVIFYGPEGGETE
jgi:mannose-6-phosphate isomerase-like protein (cupin superfamily)